MRRSGVPKSKFADLQQVETATAAGTISTAGDATAIITSDYVAGSPVTVTFAVALNDTATLWAAKARTAIAADAAVSAEYLVSGATISIVLTRKLLGLHDETLNIALADSTSAGITEAATSTMTTAGLKNAASESEPGVVSFATTAEINTGTEAAKAMSPDAFQASNRNVRYIKWRAVDKDTSVTGSDSTVLERITSDIAGVIVNVSGIRPAVDNDVVGAGGAGTYDIHLNGTTIFSTKITTDAGEATSRTATAACALATTALAVGDILTFFCDTAQSGTAEKGAVFTIPVLET